MAADAARRRATYEDLLAAPEHCIAELVNGELVVQPRPAGPHAHAASGLGMDLGGPFDRGRGGPGGWLIVYEPELHLGGDVVVPDLAGWRRERLPDLSAAHFTLAPDWICEVLSPRTARHDRGPKADLYARAQIPHLWFVDPQARLLEAFALVDGSWSRLGAWGGDDEARVPPFDAIALELKLLWIPEAPAEPATDD